MDSRFHLLHPRDTLSRAVEMFQTASREEKRKIFGLMVVDDEDRLVGMISMYDILLFLQPKHVRIWSEMEEPDLDQLFTELLERAKGIEAGDIMTTEVVTISPDTHLLAVADIMLKKHVRRLPVTENGRIIGIVYISSLFHHMLSGFLPSQGQTPW
ncbi:MAG: CBS domain-containing protein [Desulfoprunum sp.]|uniref:CBS domain-containing protein n=1 Tax=Desulfoprunum sp. TaxID=2020866 RepID=UPI003C715681